MCGKENMFTMERKYTEEKLLSGGEKKWREENVLLVGDGVGG